MKKSLLYLLFNWNIYTHINYVNIIWKWAKKQTLTIVDQYSHETWKLKYILFFPIVPQNLKIFKPKFDIWEQKKPGHVLHSVDSCCFTKSFVNRSRAFPWWPHQIQILDFSLHLKKLIVLMVLKTQERMINIILM